MKAGGQHNQYSEEDGDDAGGGFDEEYIDDDYGDKPAKAPIKPA